ncbi:hypothetical protein [Sphingobium yanoikuyae]|uniref:hypothetical protein n=1 Tax=Sphingobium yanoikuyae TaxID=13690 RepID=UPI000AEA6447|nr:hypothetical protein [Sphingobium yanoikuyae]
MHIHYHDILSRISDEPLWWFDGVPRFSPFKPDDVCVYGVDTVLVHTECRSCRKRYDVAFRSAYIREKIAYEASLDLGDPPNACCRVGPTMSSIEIEIIEYWRPLPFPTLGWERVPEWERQLVDAKRDARSDQIEPVFSRLYGSSDEADWRQARQDGNIPVMVSILKKYGCELPENVAHMLDVERRRSDLERTLSSSGQRRES